MTNLCNDLQSVIDGFGNIFWIGQRLKSQNIIDSTNVWSYTTETYESLHKEFIKIPYRSSNNYKS